MQGKRGPLYEGLPTIEEHRNMPSYVAAKRLIYGNMTDKIYIGDAYDFKGGTRKHTQYRHRNCGVYIDLFDGVSCEAKNIIFKRLSYK